MLKPYTQGLVCALKAAAFRRLCVETISAIRACLPSYAAAFRRLCVETWFLLGCFNHAEPAAFRRLCVETIMFGIYLLMVMQPPLGGCVLKLESQGYHYDESKAAAFRRLCVET